MSNADTNQAGLNNAIMRLERGSLTTGEER